MNENIIDLKIPEVLESLEVILEADEEVFELEARGNCCNGMQIC